MCLLEAHVNNLVPGLLSGCVLDDQGVRDFQASSGTHEFSCSLGTGGLLPWGKVAGGMRLTRPVTSVQCWGQCVEPCMCHSGAVLN